MPFLPHTLEEEQAMLKDMGICTIEELFRDIPEQLRLKRKLNLPKGLSEKAAWDEVERLAHRNKDIGQYLCFRGAGAYEHYQPKAVKHILSRSEFFTFLFHFLLLTYINLFIIWHTTTKYIVYYYSLFFS